MPVYHKEPENDSPTRMTRKPYQSFACALLHLSPISLYCNLEFLQSDLDKLKEEAFNVRWMDTADWKSEEDLHSDLMRQLNFPSYYGKNLNALNDCMQDLTIEDDGVMALVLKNYDDFSRVEEEVSRAILDIFASGSRLLQVFGKTLLVIVHSKDPDIQLGEFGAVSACWNQREFIRSKRGTG